MNARDLSTSGERTVLEIARLLSDLLPVRHSGEYGNIVVTCATLTEAHVDNAMKELFSASGALANEISQRLYGEVRDSIYRSWDSRFKWMSQAFGLNISGAKFAQDFRLLIDLRNSLVHGGGSLTAMQTSKIPQMIAIKDGLNRVLGVESHGRRLVLHEGVPVRAARVCKEFIIGFDGTVKRTYPKFDI